MMTSIVVVAETTLMASLATLTPSAQRSVSNGWSIDSNPFELIILTLAGKWYRKTHGHERYADRSHYKM